MASDARPRAGRRCWRRASRPVGQASSGLVAKTVSCGPSSFPGLAFLRVPDPKKIKNRLHIDLNPTDQAAEVQRLLALGATRIGHRPRRRRLDRHGRPGGKRVLHPGPPARLVVTPRHRPNSTKITITAGVLGTAAARQYASGEGARCLIGILRTGRHPHCPDSCGPPATAARRGPLARLRSRQSHLQ